MVISPGCAAQAVPESARVSKEAAALAAACFVLMSIEVSSDSLIACDDIMEYSDVCQGDGLWVPASWLWASGRAIAAAFAGSEKRPG
jgi:hypothetical protein